MGALDKVLAQTGTGTRMPPSQVVGSRESELVLAALEELDYIFRLADSDKDGDDDAKDDADSDSDHASHALFKKLTGKGMPDKMASAMCAKHDKALAATASLTRARNCLLGIGLPRSGNWVELTAASPDYLGLADSDPKKPYGDVEYADPGYQADGKKRYPIDADHVQAAWSYINKASNASQYTPEQLKTMKAKIKAAMQKNGHDVSDDTDDKAAASNVVAGDYLLALASDAVSNLSFSTMLHPSESMHHGNFHGSHNHAHPAEAAHAHMHFHNGDSHHDMHPHGGL